MLSRDLEKVLVSFMVEDVFVLTLLVGFFLGILIRQAEVVQSRVDDGSDLVG